MSDFKVVRLVTQGEMSNQQEKRDEQCKKMIMKTCQQIKDRVTVIQVPGGFLFDFDNISGFKPWPKSVFSEFQSITETVAKTLEKLFTKELKKALREKTDFLTLGIDVLDNDTDVCSLCAELVGTYDTQKMAVVSWTGKSYPTQQEQGNLICCPKLETHFQQFNGTCVLVLGCHDLNMFSFRSRASTAEGTSKAMVIKEMQSLCDRHKPEVVLQHPHRTDTPNIWTQGWLGVRKFLPEVKTYSSGIHYYNCEGKPRKPLSSVLKGTAKGQVQNIIFTCSENGAVNGL